MPDKEIAKKIWVEPKLFSLDIKKTEGGVDPGSPEDTAAPSPGAVS